MVGSHEYDCTGYGMHLDEDCREGKENAVSLSYSLDFACRHNRTLCSLHV